MRFTRLIVSAAVALGTAAAPALAPAQTAPAWMHVDAAKKTVNFDILMAPNGDNGGLNFNGYHHGAMTITIPTGWHVDMNVTNKGFGAIPHSLEVINVAEGIPAQGSEPPAFDGAETVELTDGMAVGKSDHATFTTDTPGKYWIFCGVPNHGVGGMWDYLVVSSTATAPSVDIKSTDMKMK
jgi:sulfocyanin